MDAEHLAFHDETFDFVWSWGVIHHSSNTDTVLSEIKRVLKPGGQAVIMVYYRGWYSYYLFGLIRGIFQGNFFRGETLHQIMQMHTDGALARYYTCRSWRNLVTDRFEVRKLKIMGNKTDLVPLPRGKIKTAFLSLIPKRITVLLLKNLKMGSFLISELIVRK